MVGANTSQKAPAAMYLRMSSRSNSSPVVAANAGAARPPPNIVFAAVLMVQPLSVQNTIVYQIIQTNITA